MVWLDACVAELPAPRTDDMLAAAEIRVCCRMAVPSSFRFSSRATTLWAGGAKPPADCQSLRS